MGNCAFVLQGWGQFQELYASILRLLAAGSYGYIPASAGVKLTRTLKSLLRVQSLINESQQSSSGGAFIAVGLPQTVDLSPHNLAWASTKRRELICSRKWLIEESWLDGRAREHRYNLPREVLSKFAVACLKVHVTLH